MKIGGPKNTAKYNVEEPEDARNSHNLGRAHERYSKITIRTTQEFVLLVSRES